MIVFNLSCASGHVFEGWFASSEAFDRQQADGQLSCPVCGDHHVTRGLSAPRLNLSHGTGEGTPPSGVANTALLPPESLQALQALWSQTVRMVLDHTEDVGHRFAEEARRIHYAEAPARGIRGQASAEEAASLREEGIEVVALPLTMVPKDSLQ